MINETHVLHSYTYNVPKYIVYTQCNIIFQETGATLLTNYLMLYNN